MFFVTTYLSSRPPLTDQKRGCVGISPLYTSSSAKQNATDIPNSPSSSSSVGTKGSVSPARYVRPGMNDMDEGTARSDRRNAMAEREETPPTVVGSDYLTVADRAHQKMV